MAPIGAFGRTSISVMASTGCDEVSNAPNAPAHIGQCHDAEGEDIVTRPLFREAEQDPSCRIRERHSVLIDGRIKLCDEHCTNVPVCQVTDVNEPRRLSTIGHTCDLEGMADMMGS